jgi:hypothetical protein
MCALIFRTTFEIFLILRRIERGMIKKNIDWPSYKVPVILVRF